jgi:hypothetical protein
MPLQFTENKSGSARLNVNANPRAKLASFISVDWDAVTDKPDALLYEAQALSDAEQDQALANIDAGDVTWTGIHSFSNRVIVRSGNNAQFNDPTNTNGFWLKNSSAKLGINFNNGTDLFAFRSNGTYVTFAAGASAAGANGDTTWLNASPYLIGVDAAGAVTNYAISPNGQYATVNATRASDNAAVSQTNVIADAAVIAGDHATLTHNVWARYTHAVKTAGAAAGLRLIGHELSAINLGSVVASDPYNPNPSGLTEGMRITSGYGDAANAVSAALMIKDNGGEFNSGIVFGSDAFDLTATPIPDAVALAEPFSITWFSAAATKRWQVYSDATDHNLNVVGAGSLRVGPASSSYVNILGGTDPKVRVKTNTAIAVTGISDPSYTQAGTGTSDATMWLSGWGTGIPGRIILGNSRNGTIGSQTAVVSGDVLGEFRFVGSDGTSMQRSSYIQARADGNPASSATPGKIVLMTAAAGVGTPTDKFEVDKDGIVECITGELRIAGDNGGKASRNTITGVSDLTANSTGVGSIKFKGTTSRDSSGFIKIYIGTTAYYVPVFSAITA